MTTRTVNSRFNRAAQGAAWTPLVATAVKEPTHEQEMEYLARMIQMIIKGDKKNGKAQI